MLTQGSQALYCANTIRHIGHVEGNRNDKVTKVIQVIKRKGLDHALSWTIIILGLATVVLLIFGLFVAVSYDGLQDGRFFFADPLTLWI